MKYKLDPEKEERFEMAGILCQQKDYKLAYLFNYKLKFSFAKSKNLNRFIDAEKPNIEFSFYYFYDEMNRIGYYLIANRFQDNVLVDSLKHLDYFLVVKTENVQFYLNNLIKSLKNAPEVLGVFNINKSSFPNIKYFFQDIELHLTSIFREDKMQEEEVKNHLLKNRVSRGTKR